MAKYRSIQTMFWQDDFMVQLSFEEKAFYAYLLTNTRTTQCGIYSFSLIMASVELNCSKEKIRGLLEKFISYGKILFDESKSEVMILNWYKYNITSSRNTLLCINKELKEVKNRDFVKKLYELCQNTDYQLEVIFNGIEIPGYKEKDDGKAPLNSGADEADIIAEEAAVDEDASDYGTGSSTKTAGSLGSVVDCYNSNVHKGNLLDSAFLLKWSQKVDDDVIIMAIDRTVKSDVKNIGYINGILNNWYEAGCKTAPDVIAYTEKWNNSRTNESRSNAAAYKIVDL